MAAPQPGVHEGMEGLCYPDAQEHESRSVLQSFRLEDQAGVRLEDGTFPLDEDREGVAPMQWRNLGAAGKARLTVCLCGT